MKGSTLKPVFLFLSISSAYAFNANLNNRRRPTQSPVSISPDSLPQTSFDRDTQSYDLLKEQANALFSFGEGEKEKIVNPYGLWCVIVTLIINPVWALAMSAMNMVNQINEDFDPKREKYDATGKIWSKVWLTMTNSYPTVSGNVEQLKEYNGPCLFVANHASWLDIPVLCTVLDPVFKFISKGELRKVPCIGQQLVGGNHILIDRDDRKSQLKTFKEGLAWLNKGVPIMAFPEGMRSPDGRLMEFKKGVFSLAMKTNVPIVPITLSHTNAVMPGYSLFPVQSGAGKVHVHVNDIIYSEGKSDAELEALVRKAFLETLPTCQLPLVKDEEAIEEVEKAIKAAVPEKATADVKEREPQLV